MAALTAVLPAEDGTLGPLVPAHWIFDIMRGVNLADKETGK